MELFKETLIKVSIVAGYILLTILIILSVIFTGYVSGNLISKQDCNRYERITGKDTKFEWAIGQSCYVHTKDNGWILLDQLKVNN